MKRWRCLFGVHFWKYFGAWRRQCSECKKTQTRIDTDCYDFMGPIYTWIDDEPARRVSVIELDRRENHEQ